ncbi:MAG: dihydroorotate dehydrogenase [Nitrospiraceae bacterium]|nr:MAG: dihydroorotate dehydrogenase [Nitrospiraceae bacterium]
MVAKRTLNLNTGLGRLKLKNPVMTASGTFGYGKEYSEFIDLNKLGAIVVKGISLRPMKGNPEPRICETPCGMLNAIGLQNVGLKGFIKQQLPYLRKLETKIIVNVLGNSIDEYCELAEKLDGTGINAIELNVSCPNVKKGGIVFGTDPKNFGELIKCVRRKTTLPLISKLSPNVTDIKLFARIAEDSGSDIISLINTITGMSIDIKTRKPRLANITGGLSGPAIRPVAVRMVRECYKTVRIPIIGMGGIISAEDAVEFILAGASAVAVGTGNFINPGATIDILKGIKSYMSEEGISSLKELIGAAQC